MMFVLNKKK